MPNIFKILTSHAFDEALEKGVFLGSDVDIKDGFIHFSSAGQAVETAARHFGGQADLMILCFAAASLGEALKWEPSRGGQLFPHLYVSLDMRHLVWAKPLAWNGRAHDFPPETFA